MTGYFDYYTPERIQLIGMKEWSYLMKMTSHNRHQVLLKMFQPTTPVVIIARDLEIPDEMMQAAEEKLKVKMEKAKSAKPAAKRTSTKKVASKTPDTEK